MKHKYLIIFAITALISVGSLIGRTYASAYNPFQGVCSQGGASSTLCSAQTTSTNDPVIVKILHVAQVLDILIGVIAVVMIVIGGFRFVISAGNSNSVSGARNQIIYALIGLIVAALAQAIILFVLHKLVK